MIKPTLDKILEKMIEAIPAVMADRPKETRLFWPIRPVAKKPDNG